MKLAIDTNAFSDLNRGYPDIKKFINKQNDLFVPFIVIAELRAGFLLGNKLAENESMLTEFLDQSNVTSLYPTDKTTQVFADIFTALRKAGKPIGTNDIWIAALCLQHDVPLLTKDNDFSNIVNLKLL